MELIDLLTWQAMATILVATAIVLVAWMKTPPYTTFANIQAFLEALVSTFVLAVLVTLGLAAGSAPFELVSIGGLLSVIGLTYLGWGAVSILQNKVAPASGPP